MVQRIFESVPNYMHVMAIELSNTMCAVVSAAISMRGSTSNAPMGPSSTTTSQPAAGGAATLDVVYYY